MTAHRDHWACTGAVVRKPSQTRKSFTALIQARGATAAHFNRAVYERLKPGGSYVIVDHAAAVGAGTRDAQSLHRIEPASVREEVEAADHTGRGKHLARAQGRSALDQGVRSLDQGRPIASPIGS